MIRGQERGCEGEKSSGHVRRGAVCQAAEDGRFCLLSSAEERVLQSASSPCRGTRLSTGRGGKKEKRKKNRRGSMQLLYTWADGQAAPRPKSHNVFVISPQIAILHHISKSVW